MRARWQWVSVVAAMILMLPLGRSAGAQGSTARDAEDLVADELLAAEDIGDLDLDLALEGDFLDADQPTHGGGGGHGPGGAMGQGAGRPGMEMLHQFMQNMGGMGAMGGMGRPSLHEQLKLTDEQRTKLTDIHEAGERAAIPIRGNIRLAEMDLHKLMRADKPDARAIDAQIDKLAGLKGSLQKAHAARMLEARTIFTPEQRKTLRENHARHPLRNLGRRIKHHMRTL